MHHAVSIVFIVYCVADQRSIYCCIIISARGNDDGEDGTPRPKRERWIAAPLPWCWEGTVVQWRHRDLSLSSCADALVSPSRWLALCQNPASASGDCGRRRLREHVWLPSTGRTCTWVQALACVSGSRFDRSVLYHINGAAPPGIEVTVLGSGLPRRCPSPPSCRRRGRSTDAAYDTIACVARARRA